MAEVAPRFTVVIPFLNSIQHLRTTAPAVVAAARKAGRVEIIGVDNGATDGSAEYIQSLAPDIVRIVTMTGATIAELRNRGAREGKGQYLSFIDTDVGIEADYFAEAEAVLETTRAAATGCEYALPSRPHWIERTLHDLHYIGRDRDVVYLNAGNFVVRRDAFEAVGGFRNDLLTGEDADIGHRLVRNGYRLFESTRVHGVHHGNPKSLREHYRRTVWHSLGMFATVTRHRFDRPTAMLVLHLAATLAGIAVLVASPLTIPARIALAILFQLVAPAATVAYRIAQTQRLPRLDAAILLYWLYYWARMHALALLATGRSGRYRK